MSELSFQGQVALVTGASRGIGSAIARELAQRGVRVVGTATTDDGAQRITQALAGFEGCRGARLDVNDGPAADALVEAIVNEHGALHILVNNAGITRDMLAMRLKDEDWDAVLDTNLKAVFRLCRAAIRPMMKQRYGRIVNITSVVGAAGNPGQANYAAAKAGVAGMTRALARELGRYGVTCNSISPTAGTRLTMTDEVRAGFRKRMEMGIITRERFEQVTNPPGPEFIAPVVVWLATDAAANVNGQCVRAVQGKVAMFQEPTERAALLKTENNGMFTLDDLDEHFMNSLMAGVTNPAPPEKDIDKK